MKLRVQRLTELRPAMVHWRPVAAICVLAANPVYAQDPPSPDPCHRDDTSQLVAGGAVASLFTGAAPAVAALQPAVAGFPGNAIDAYVGPKGLWACTVSVTGAKVPGQMAATGPVTNCIWNPMDGLQLSATNYGMVFSKIKGQSTHTGPGDSGLGIKRAVQLPDGSTIAVSGNVSANFSSRAVKLGLSNGPVIQITGTWTKPIGRINTVSFSVSDAYLLGQREHQIGVSGVDTIALNPNWNLFFEVDGVKYAGRTNGAQYSLYGGVGATYTFDGDDGQPGPWSVGLGVYRDIAHKGPGTNTGTWARLGVNYQFVPPLDPAAASKPAILF